MKKNIIYKYKERDNVISQAQIELIENVYSLSYPEHKESFKQMCNDGHDKKYGKYVWPCDFYYMPEKAVKDIFDSFKDAYGFSNEWKDNIQFLIDCLYIKPGFKEVYVPSEWSNNEKVRGYEDQNLIKDIIGEDQANKLKQILEEYRDTYKFGLPDLNHFSSIYLSMPSSNRETVINAWKEVFNKDIELPDDDQWVDEYSIADDIDEEDIPDDQCQIDEYEIDDKDMVE